MQWDVPIIFPTFSLGEVSSATLVYEDSSLKLKYKGADLCPDSGLPYMSVITFLCDTEDNVVSSLVLAVTLTGPTV